MTGGAGTVDLSAALALVSNVWFTDIVSCLNDAANLTALATEAERRYGAMVKKDTHVYYGYRGTYGQALALAETLNSRFMTCVPAQNPRWAPWIMAGIAGAIAAQALNNDPSRQLRALELTGLTGLAPDDADLFTDAMRNVLLQSGLSTFTVDQDGTVRIERMVTNNQTDAEENPTTAWRNIMVPKTVSRVRYEWNTYISATYPRAKLADDASRMVGIATGVVTPGALKGSWAAQSELYETVEGWLTDTDALAQQAAFTINPTDRNRCDAALPIRVMGSLIVMANSIQLQA
nr:phage tail sheath subtilisin-like domain-containing protein [Komagataeibacter sp. FNDCF1]